MVRILKAFSKENFFRYHPLGRYKCVAVDVFQFEEQSLIIKRSLIGRFLKQIILLSKEIL